jgi:DNA-binding Xre family transcriptional regulator
VKWKLRWAAAQRDIWRPSDLLVAFQEVGFNPSLSKVAALWSGTPVSVRLDDLERICDALNCSVADLIEAEPHSVQHVARNEGVARAVGSEVGGPARPMPRDPRAPRSLPPN